MQDRHLEALQTLRLTTERELQAAEKNDDIVANDKANRKLKKIADLEHEYLNRHGLYDLHPEKSDDQIKRMQYDITQRITRLTNPVAREAYNKRGREFMGRKKEVNDANVVSDKSKKVGTEEFRQVKIAEWELKLQKADTKSKKDTARKRLKYFKGTDEERERVKKQNADSQKKHANKKKKEELLQQRVDNESPEPSAPKIKRVRIKIGGQSIDETLAAQPAPINSEVIADNFIPPLSDILPPIIDMTDAVPDFDFNADIQDYGLATNKFTIWNSQKQNTSPAPTQNSSHSPDKKRSLE